MPITCSACQRRRVAARVREMAAAPELMLQIVQVCWNARTKARLSPNAAAAHQALRLDRRTAAQCRAGLPGVAGCKFCGTQSDGSQSARLRALHNQGARCHNGVQGLFCRD